MTIGFVSEVACGSHGSGMRMSILFLGAPLKHEYNHVQRHVRQSLVDLHVLNLLLPGCLLVGKSVVLRIQVSSRTCLVRRCLPVNSLIMAARAPGKVMRGVQAVTIPVQALHGTPCHHANVRR